MLVMTQQQMAEAVEAPCNKIRALINDIQRQAATKPDVVYLTGGSARSPMLRQSIKAVISRHSNRQWRLLWIRYRRLSALVLIYVSVN